MSKYQQIRVRVEPVYPKKGLAGVYPRLLRQLSRVEPKLAQQAPSLYELAPYLVHLSQLDNLGPQVEQALSDLGPEVLQLRRRIEEAIADWKLGPAETLLYELEEVLGRLDKALPALEPE